MAFLGVYACRGTGFWWTGPPGCPPLAPQVQIKLEILAPKSLPWTKDTTLCQVPGSGTPPPPCLLPPLSLGDMA